MRRKRILFGAVLLAAVFLCVGCAAEPGGSDDTPSVTIDIAAIEGVTPPAVGNEPVSVITETDQYTGTVVWEPRVEWEPRNPFNFSTVYTATITLMPKAGYTLNGVQANFFTVAGADSVSNAAASGRVTAVFPRTSPTPDFSITTQPAETTTVTQGSISGSLSVEASITGGATLCYQWYSNTWSSTTSGTVIDGATGSSFSIPTTLTANGAWAENYYYYCGVWIEGEGGGRYSGVRYSNVAAVTVNPRYDITITKQPESLTVTEGMITEYLSVTAEVTPEKALSYQWYSNTSGSNTGGTKLDGETDESFILPSELTEGKYYYFCEISVPGLPFSVRSNAVTVTVGVAINIVMWLTPITEVNVIAQTAYIQANTDTPFTIASTAGNYTVDQWYLNGVPAGTSSTYTFNRSAGVYELAVVVTFNLAGQKFSGSCRVTVR